MDIFFYEAFLEEEEALRRGLRDNITAGFTSRTIQESGHASPPADLISTRTQSIIPPAWGPHRKGILTRRTGHDHLASFLEGPGSLVKAGYLPCTAAGQWPSSPAALAGPHEEIRAQMNHLKGFERDGLTGMECRARPCWWWGWGNIGYEICRIGEALGNECPRGRPHSKAPGIRYVSIHDAMGESRRDLLRHEPDETQCGIFFP
jgi:D-lactate dehydrogenase